MEYKKRLVDEILDFKLECKGAVVIEGTKWCGKTTTASLKAKSILKMDDYNLNIRNRILVDIDLYNMLKGETPRLIDEWQIAPKFWDAIRNEVDKRGLEGQFILTGSAVPVETTEITHSGTGRYTWLLMRPMSLYESGESTGEISLEELFKSDKNIYAENKLTLNDLAFLVCRGGWPHSINMKERNALEQAFDYLDGVIHSDINRADGISKNPERVKRLMRSYARNQGTQVSLSTIKKDMILNDVNSLDDDTISSYINALKKIFVIEDMAAWCPNLRSKTAIRTSETRYYVDPSIAVASLGLGPKDLINDLNTFGLLFETLCIRDLRVYAQTLNGNVYHYRDGNDLECDAVIHLRNGRYGLIEIKLGGDYLIEEGVKNLVKLKNKIDDTKMFKPSFLMVLVGIGNYAYKREDGIYVVPVGCLKN